MKISFVHWGVPRPTDGSQRSWRAAKWLAERHEVTLVPLGEAASEDIARGTAANLRVEEAVTPPDYERFGTSVHRFLPARLGKEWREVREEIQNRCRGSNWVFMGWWGLPAIWDTTEDRETTFTWDWDVLSLWHLSAAAWLAKREPLRAGLRLVNAGSFRIMERKYLRRMHMVTTPSEREKAWFEDRLRVRSLWVRNCVDVDHFGTVDPEVSSDDPRIGFMGSLDYPPNRDGLTWFLKRVWPRVLKKIPRTRLLIAGRGTGTYLDGLQTKYPRLEIRRNVPEPRELYQSADVVVVPIWYGGGIPYKVLEACASARAVVTTPHVANAAGDKLNVLPVAHSSEEFEELTVMYLEDRQTSAVRGAKLREWIKATYSTERWNEDMERLEEWVQLGHHLR